MTHKIVRVRSWTEQRSREQDRNSRTVILRSYVYDLSGSRSRKLVDAWTKDRVSGLYDRESKRSLLFFI